MRDKSTTSITRAAVYRPRVCATCGGPFESRSSKKRFCDACGGARERLADRNRARAKLRLAGAREVGSQVICSHCLAPFSLTCGSQKFCDPCSAERLNRWHRVKRSSDPARNLADRMTRGINASLASGKEGRSWRSMVPYTLADLMLHLERQFLSGMTWENRSEWHIDHIVPQSSFHFTSSDDPEFKRCWALTNLRPLWAKDNVRKSGKRTHLI